MKKLIIALLTLATFQAISAGKYVGTVLKLKTSNPACTGSSFFNEMQTLQQTQSYVLLSQSDVSEEPEDLIAVLYNAMDEYKYNLNTPASYTARRNSNRNKWNNNTQSCLIFAGFSTEQMLY